MNGWQRERKSTWTSIVKLIGHMACTALAFVGLFTFGWLADWVFDVLNILHPFRPEVQAFMGKAALWFTYLDAFSCAIVLLVGLVGFVYELLER